MTLPSATVRANIVSESAEGARSQNAVEEYRSLTFRETAGKS